MEERITALEREVETLIAINAGLVAVVTSLIATHSRYEDLQLTGPVAIEKAVAGLVKSDRQRETARSVAESLLHTQALLPGAIQQYLAAQLRGASKK